MLPNWTFDLLLHLSRFPPTSRSKVAETWDVCSSRTRGKSSSSNIFGFLGFQKSKGTCTRGVSMALSIVQSRWLHLSFWYVFLTKKAIPSSQISSPGVKRGAREVRRLIHMIKKVITVVHILAATFDAPSCQIGLIYQENEHLSELWGTSLDQVMWTFTYDVY